MALVITPRGHYKRVFPVLISDFIPHKRVNIPVKVSNRTYKVKING